MNNNTEKPIMMVCIASGQTMQNLLPALYLNPVKLSVICSENVKSTSSFEYLKRVIANITPNINVEKVNLSEESPNWEQVQTFANPCFKHFKDKYNEFRLILNITGGTKIMSASMLSSWQALGLEAFYCHTGKTVTLEWLNQHKSTEQSFKQQSPLLNIEHYLNAHGYELIDKNWKNNHRAKVKQALKNKEITHKLSNYAAKNSNEKNYFGKINTAAERKLNKNISPKEQQKPISGALKNDLLPLYQFLTKQQLLSYKEINNNGKTFVEHQFKDEATAKFLNGFWVEDYLTNILQELEQENIIAPECWASGIKIKIEGSKDEYAQNELDVAILSRNRLLIIECKSSHLENQDPINKLLMLKEKGGGLFGEAWILSAKNPKQEFVSRANVFKIKVFSMQAFTDIKQTLKAWVLGEKIQNSEETDQPLNAIQLALQKLQKQ